MFELRYFFYSCLLKSFVGTLVCERILKDECVGKGLQGQRKKKMNPRTVSVSSNTIIEL